MTRRQIDIVLGVPTPTSERMFFLEVMKAIGILLVTNSHMRNFYPLRELSTGGLLGNTLFFFASGVAITAGLQYRPRSFLDWYGRRLERVYFDLWVVTGLLLIAGLVPLGGLMDLFARFLFPNEYWFLPAVAVLYMPAFAAARHVPARHLPLLVGAVLIAFLLLASIAIDHQRWSAEDNVPLKSVFYLAAMLAGVYASRLPPSAAGVGRRALMLAAATVGFFGFLALMRVTSIYTFQTLAQLLALVWTLTFFDFVRHQSVEAAIQRRFAVPVGFLGRLTLQIYLVQVPLLTSTNLDSLPFPANVVAFMTTLLLLAWLLDLVMTRLRRYWRKAPVFEPGLRRPL